MTRLDFFIVRVESKENCPDNCSQGRIKGISIEKQRSKDNCKDSYDKGNGNLRFWCQETFRIVIFRFAILPISVEGDKVNH